MKNFHRHGPVCIRCLDFLEDVHPKLVDWYEFVKINFPDAHISCGFRNEKEQAEAFKKKVTRVQWPDSKHNKMPAQAIDLFQLSPDRKAIFSMEYYKAIWDFVVDSNWEHTIEWGGNWSKFPDGPHFQLSLNFFARERAKNGKQKPS